MNMTSSPETSVRAKYGNSLWVLAFLLAFPSFGFVQKYAGLVGVVIYSVVVIMLVIAAAYISRRTSIWQHAHFRKLSTLLILALGGGFIMLNPIEDGRGPGKSSDRDEGLEMAVNRMTRGETPYYPSNPIAGPLSVLPGSIFLASPFVGLGNSGFQNIFWLSVFLFVACSYFGDKAYALCLLSVSLGVSFAAQYEFVSGGDLIANGIFVAVFFWYALKAWTRCSTPMWARMISCLLLGIGLASRANFLLLLPLFGAVIWRTSGWKSAFHAGFLVACSAIAITLPFYLHDPAGFTPLLTRQKLGGSDHVNHAMIAISVVVSMLCTWILWRRRYPDTVAMFFRCCTWVTITPMVAVVLLSSWIGGFPDFSFLRDRFGLMYVFFAILGWGAPWRNELGRFSLLPGRNVGETY